jgi:hypothetical protein
VRPSSHRLASLAVAAVVGAVAIAAVATNFAGGRPHSAPPTVTPPPAVPLTTPAAGNVELLPPPGRLPGRLDVVLDDCGLAEVDLASLARRPVGLVGYCDTWFAPAGAFAVGVPDPDAPRTSPLARVDMRTGRAREVGLATGSEYEGPPAIADDGTVAVCDHGLHLARRGRFWSLRGSCASAALGARIVAVGRRTRAIVDPITGSVLYPLPPGPTLYNPALVASRGGRKLALVGFDAGAFHAEVTEIDTATGHVSRPVAAGIGNRYHRLELSDDGHLIALLTEGGWDVWNLRRRTHLQAVGGWQIRDVAFSPDSGTIAVATDVGIVFVNGTTLAPRSLLPLIVRRVAWLR